MQEGISLSRCMVRTTHKTVWIASNVHVAGTAKDTHTHVKETAFRNMTMLCVRIILHYVVLTHADIISFLS